jgi:RimJ/RimL family protein N-acetyltransferase
MTIAFARTPEEIAYLTAWAAERIKGIAPEDFGPCDGMGVVHGDELVAAVIFHDWHPKERTLQCSMAADTPRWATKESIGMLLRFAFIHKAVNVLWTATPHTSARVLRFNEGCGMRREGTLRHRFGQGVHAVICSMTLIEFRRSKWSKI